jgi:hypothetical protein
VVDDDGPILSIELFWDARPDSSSFVAGTCFDGDVRTMDWRLIDAETGDVVARRSEACANGIDVIDPDPGEYELELTGYRRVLAAEGEPPVDEPLWNVTCTGLVVLRFDVAYECNIEAPSEQ